ncbi:hypothetical protein GCM10014719_09850 [Planomonospora parontospora subsp. antibiotica]|nr:hypothetical protein GCM10014719_09850 [Planomonospora parontospora subsp. antibiotica]GII14699.1 hypothetical protein Ppa05_14250 [Planomonospora parontospora subsp. antibiotica]
MFRIAHTAGPVRDNGDARRQGVRPAGAGRAVRLQGPRTGRSTAQNQLPAADMETATIGSSPP